MGLREVACPDGDPRSWTLGQYGAGSEKWELGRAMLWEPVPSGRAFRLAELLAAALKTNSPWKR